MTRRCMVTVALLAAAQPGFLAAETVREARARAIAGTLATIDQQVAAHGGSWDAWIEELRDYRAGLMQHRR